MLPTGTVASHESGFPESIGGWQAYGTERGDHRSIRLDDGSRIELDTDSLVHVRFTGDHRAIVLDRGEAFFTVAPEEHRPFSVRVHDTIVRTLGVQFAVRLRQRPEIDLLVIHGQVSVSSPDDGLAAFRPVLGPGQAASIRRSSMHVESLGVAEAERRLAWLQGRLAFRDAPLGEVVQAFNRYNRLQLRIGDLQITNLRISGTFLATDVETFVCTLETVFDVHGVLQSVESPGSPVLHLLGSAGTLQ